MTFFFASSTPLRIASGTSPALPSPAPTWPWPSPTTTIALKLKRRPPLTTFATRLIWTTRSSSVSLLASILGMCPSRSEVEAGFARGLGERADPPVISEAGPVEDDVADARLLRPIGEQLADRLRAVGLRPVGAPELGLEARRRRERSAGGVVDHLGVDVVEAAEDRQARALDRPRQPETDPLVALASRGAAAADLRHRVRSPECVVTSCRRSCRPCRPCGGPAPRRTARPCPCTARACVWRGPWPRSRPRAACRSRPRPAGWGSRARSLSPSAARPRPDGCSRGSAAADRRSSGRDSRHR